MPIEADERRRLGNTSFTQLDNRCVTAERDVSCRTESNIRRMRKAIYEA